MIPKRGRADKMITRIEQVSIPVSDQDRALAFYRDKLGFQVANDQPDGQGGRWLEVAIPGAQTRLVLYPPVNDGQKAMMGSFSNVLFSTDNLKKLYDELSLRGVKFTVPVTEQPWGTFAQFVDPDGNEFLVSQT